MTETDSRIATADAQAANSRTAFLSTLALTKQRLSPASLKKEATNATLDTALDRIDDAKQIAREHPVKVIGLVAALLAIAARRPLWALTRDLWDKGRDAYRQHLDQDTTEDDHAQE